MFFSQIKRNQKKQLEILLHPRTVNNLLHLHRLHLSLHLETKEETHHIHLRHKKKAKEPSKQKGLNRLHIWEYVLYIKLLLRIPVHIVYIITLFVTVYFVRSVYQIETEFASRLEMITCCVN